MSLSTSPDAVGHAKFVSATRIYSKSKYALPGRTKSAPKLMAYYAFICGTP